MANIQKRTEKYNEFRRFLKKKYKFRLDIIRNIIEGCTLDKNEWGEVSMQSIWDVTNTDLNSISMATVSDCVGALCQEDKFNPLKYWLEGLPKTEENAIEQLCSYLILEDERQRDRLVQSLKKWFVLAIKCLYEKNFAAKQCIVLEGPSGIGKTPFCKFLLLLNSHLEPFVKVNPSLSTYNKDSLIELTSNFLIILDEIDDFMKNKDRRENFKSYMTETSINVRLPYGKGNTTKHRIASFLGTCNNSQFLPNAKDSQRFIVFSINKIKNRALNHPDGCVEDFDVSKCWAQAYNLYKLGLFTEFSRDELLISEQENEKYRCNSMEFEVLRDFFGVGASEDDFLTPTQICGYMNSVQSMCVFNSPTNLGRALIRLGFKRCKKKGIYGYMVKKLIEA